MRRSALVFIAVSFVFVCGCASYGGALSKARRSFLQGCYTEAGQMLEDSLINAGKNDLLYLLEAGSSYHYASQYEKSRILLERADELARIRSCISVSNEAAAVVFDDRLKPYRCPEYERFMILYILAINRFAKGEVEAALVELNRIFEYEDEVAGKGKEWLYQPLAHYLAGLCYLRFGEYDNAKQEFAIASDLSPDNSAFRAAAEGSIEVFHKQPSGISHGWLLAFVETGLAPVRRPTQMFSSIPQFATPCSPALNAIPTIISGKNTYECAGQFDFDEMARTWMDKMSALYITREIAGAVARDVIADQVGKGFESEDAEDIARLALMITHAPDLRSWRNLPQKISAFVVPYKCGSHSISIAGLHEDATTAGEINFCIEKGKITTVVVKRR